MQLKIYAAPAVEPITLSQLKEHLRLDSETLAGNLTTYQSILSGSHGIHELMTLDVAPATAWEVGDIITGQTSTKTCVVVTVLTTKTFYVKDRSGAFQLGEIVGVTGTPGKLADQGAANPTFSSAGYYLIGTGVEVIGKTAIVNLNAGTVGAGGTVDAKIQESDDDVTYTDWTGGGFTTVNAANDEATQEKAYTGAKRYIRVVSKVLTAACEFGAEVIVNAATTAEDDTLTEDITTARLDVENDSCRKIITQTWDYCLQDWPPTDRIKIPFGNLQSITSIKWKDTDGTETTLTLTTDYLVELNGDQCGFIVLPDGCTWPSGSLYPSNPITIRFVCGYGLAADVPATIKSAIKQRCARLYANRGELITGQLVTSFSEDRTYERLINNIPRLYDRDFL